MSHPVGSPDAERLQFECLRVNHNDAMVHLTCKETKLLLPHIVAFSVDSKTPLSSFQIDDTSGSCCGGEFCYFILNKQRILRHHVGTSSDYCQEE